MKNKFAYLLAFSASILVCIAAYFSITGFAKLFSGAFYEMLVMVSGLELAKLVVTSFLYRYWEKVSKVFRTYLLIAISILMIITSAGVYGFLSSAYSITSDKLGQTDSNIEIYEKKKESINDVNNRIKSIIDSKNNRINTLTQLRTTQESRIDTLYKKNLITSARKTEQIIKEANAEIEKNNKQIDSLNTIVQAALDSSNRIDLKILELKGSDIQGEVGPLKYISRLTNSSMETVVNFFILLLVFVCDPLAVCLVIATNKVLLESKDVNEDNEEASEEYDNSIEKWRKDECEHTKRIQYDLDGDSIVFDLGQTEQVWLDEMIEMHDCYFYIFEPSKYAYDKLIKKFQANPKIKIFNFELSASNNEAGIINFLKTLNFEKISLMKINIKGSEYELLEKLLNNDICETIENYQIQFYSHKRKAIKRRKEIIKLFNERNYIHTYCYPFVWENLKKN